MKKNKKCKNCGEKMRLNFETCPRCGFCDPAKDKYVQRKDRKLPDRN